MLPQGNKVYVAGKVGQSEGAIRHFIKQIEARGYVITYDWTQVVIAKPFEDNAAATVAAQNMVRGVMEADTSVIFCPAEGGVGLHIETGVALGASLVLGFMQGERRRQILLVGEGNNRSVFHFDPGATRIKTVMDLLEGPYLPPIVEAA